MITKEQREADEAVCKAATPGPWMREWYEDGESSEGPYGVHPGARGEMVQSNDIATVPNECDDSRDVGHARHAHDADFVVVARERLPVYIAEHEAMVQRIERITVLRDNARRAADEARRDGMMQSAFDAEQRAAQYSEVLAILGGAL